MISNKRQNAVKKANETPEAWTYIWYNGWCNFVIAIF